MLVLMIILYSVSRPSLERGICCYTASLLWMKFGPGLHRSPGRFFVATCGLVSYDNLIIGSRRESFSRRREIIWARVVMAGARAVPRPQRVDRERGMKGSLRVAVAARCGRESSALRDTRAHRLTRVESYPQFRGPDFCT